MAEDLIRTLVRTPRGEEVRFENRCPESVAIAMEPDDLIEILGNLLENAARHARSRVVIDAQRRADVVTISVDDDGPGMNEDRRSDRNDFERRLDMTLTGAGLGLVIVKDLLEIYGETLCLSRSELGGLRATFIARTA
jgi:signal transduction histidine kinase